RDAFIAEIRRDVPETPVYFLHSRDLNKTGPALSGERPLPPRLSPVEFRDALQRGALALDTRAAGEYSGEHVQNSLHVGLDGQYASWVGTLVSPEQELVLIVDPEREEEAVVRLGRVGYENVTGSLAGGIEGWRNAGFPVATSPREPIVAALR